MRLILNMLHAISFYLGVRLTSLKGFLKPKSRQEHKVKSTKIAYKAYESYRLGECIVTLAKFGPEGKEEVRLKLLGYQKQREEKEARLTERAEEIMLMSPEELRVFQVEDWLKHRRYFSELKTYEALSEQYQDNNK